MYTQILFIILSSRNLTLGKKKYLQLMCAKMRKTITCVKSQQ